jgi:hypothetical protein
MKSARTIFLGLIERHLGALILRPPLKNPLIPTEISRVIGVLHIIGLLAVVELSQRPIWLTALMIFAIQPLLVYKQHRRFTFPIESLAPLILVYLMAVVRVVLAMVEQTQGSTSGTLVVPEPWGQRLDLNVAMIICSVWVVLAQLPFTATALEKSTKWIWQAAGIILIIGTTLCAGRIYFSIRTHGTTASDPFAYIQMAVDMAERQTPRHHFELAPFVAIHDLPLDPLAHVGYHAPDAKTGEAATVWPVGYSALLGLAYLLIGESGLYLLTPLMGLITLGTTALLCHEILQRREIEKRWLGAGIAALVVATSFQQLERLVVPMADIPAQVFSVLTIAFAFRAIRERTALFSALAGLSIGVAFAIRYTQVLLGFAVLVVFLLDYLEHRSRQKSLTALVFFSGAAWLVALPILWYHNKAFGGPFKVGSHELDLFDIQYIPDTAQRMFDTLATAHEFLYLAPFLVLGSIRLWVSFRRETLVLLTWLIILTGFHLFYAALRLRDLLPQFPILALVVGVGVVEIFSLLARFVKLQWLPLARLATAVIVVGLFWLRMNDILRLAIIPEFNTFGLLTPEQRDAFDEFAMSTPQDAIIAVSLTSGPINLYAHREIVRPYDWSDEEWLKFIQVALAEEYPLYILQDGYEMEAPLQLAQAHYQVTPVNQFFLPYFYPGAGSINQQLTLYRVERRQLIGDSLQPNKPLS